MAKRSSGKSFVLGAALGAAVGAVVTFFKSPKSGKENQADAKAKLGEIKDKASDVVDDATMHGRRFVSSASDSLSNTKEQASLSGKQIKSASGRFFKQAKKDIKEVFAEAKKEGGATVESVKKKLK